MIVDWLYKLFDADSFVTRDHCGPWTASFKDIYIASSGLIAPVSVLVAICLYRIGSRRRREIGFGCFQEVNRDLQQANALKDEVIAELGDTIAALRRQVDHLERMRKTGLWVAEQESALRELKTVLESTTTEEAPL